jgi:hypothetical protein
LKEKSISVPPIFVLFHPTEICEKQFDWNLFEKNMEKKVVQIGAWLRNTYSIYSIPLDQNYKNPLKIRKVALKGRAMENYFRPENATIKMNLKLNEKRDVVSNITVPTFCTCQLDQKALTSQWKSCNCDSVSMKNRHVIGLCDFIEQQFSSVKVLEHLTNDEYDELLSSNIGFMNLYDASASNGVIECMARNTPLLINPLPPVVEYLGKNYPLYYQTMREAADKLSDPELLKKGYYYLKNLDKKILSMNYFLEQIILNIYDATK